ncbi:MAG: hypothetical protein WC699_06160 [Bacteroidales bacterium]|jgi:hypothetical protein
MNHFIRILGVLTFLSLLSPFTYSQQLEIRRTRGTGTYVTFSEWKGWSVAWNQKLKSGNKFGVSFDYALKTKPYSWVYTAFDWDREIPEYKTYVESRDPNNQRFAASIFWGWCPLETRRAAIYWGPILSLNWLHMLEKVHRYSNEWFVDADFYNEYTGKKKYGAGIFLEFEMREIIFKRLSASIRMHSEVTGYKGFGSWYRAEPAQIAWWGADFGIKWDFSKSKKATI